MSQHLLKQVSVMIYISGDAEHRIMRTQGVTGYEYRSERQGGGGGARSALPSHNCHRDGGG